MKQFFKLHKLVFYLGAFLALLSCGQEKKSHLAAIHLKIFKPATLPKQRKTLTTSFNCMAVFMSWEGGSNSLCYDSSNNITAIASVAGGFLGTSAGSVSLDVEKGDNRRLQVIAFSSSESTCPVSISNLTSTQMSTLGQATILYDGIHSIIADEENISVTLDLAATATLTNCIGPVITWDGAFLNNSWDTGKWDAATWGP